MKLWSAVYVSVNAGNGRGRRREVKSRDSMECYIFFCRVVDYMHATSFDANKLKFIRIFCHMLKMLQIQSSVSQLSHSESNICRNRRLNVFKMFSTAHVARPKWVCQ